VIGKFIGVLLVFIDGAVILSLIIGGFSVGSLEFLNVNGEFLQYPPFFYDAVLPKWALTLAGFLLIGIPFLILFVLGLRILSSSIKKISKPTSLTLLGIWVIALLTMIFTGIEYGTSHVNDGQFVKKTSLNIIEKDTITLKMINDDEIYYIHNLRRSSRKYEVDIDGTPKAYSNDVNVNIKRSNSDEGYIIIQKESAGKTRSSANKNAEKIEYKFEIVDNTIVLDAYYLSNYKNIWKDEEINVTIYVPEGNTVYFDHSVKNFLNDVDNEGDIYDKDMANHHFIMTDTTLKCTDCTGNEKTI
jgi:hypothetical protein